jgi:tetratricopeptide (TPR) repeat protein
MGKVFLCSLMVLASAGAARAADDAVSARALYEKGSMLYDLGKYNEAAAAYEQAYAAKSDPALLFNIGQAYRLGGDYTQALRAYRSFLRRMPEARNRADVERHIVQLQKMIEEQNRTKSMPPTGTFRPGQTQTGPEPPGATTTPPSETTPPAATGTPPGAVTVTATPAEKQPLYKKWWLWTIVGGVVVAGVAIGVGVAVSTPNNAPAPDGTIAVVF